MGRSLGAIASKKWLIGVKMEPIEIKISPKGHVKVASGLVKSGISEKEGGACSTNCVNSLFQ
ncbi:hypothetical protein SAMN05216283_104136 [Sunxiuqinia elliptica]|uniref:Uncharacterized protein n=1 Tax=Sunxiuqinia elliptica TaxID=655355 RepID=A0A1I2HJ39_9BACT|nr:hypothetical protein SAMN05216283_104136 [Sunxiuqinia elliptica]